MSQLRYETAVRFRDLDSLGHVNYSVYLSYLEDALNEIWVKAISALGMEFHADNPGLVSVRAEIDYRAPALYGQALLVEVWISAIGNRSFTAAYRIVEKGTGTLIAEAKTVQVVTIAGLGKRAMPQKLRGILNGYRCK
jgi:acyl-CoA thioester hydrolase